MRKEIVSDFSRLIQSKLALHPFIYIACLTAKEKGTPYGEWIDCDQPLEGFVSSIERAVARCPVPEANAWIIERFEDFGSCALGPYTNLETVHTLAAFFAEYGTLGAAVLEYLEDRNGSALNEARALLENHYYGAFISKSDFIRTEHAHAQIDLPKDPCTYPFIEGYWFTHCYFALELGGAAHIFEKSRITELVAQTKKARDTAGASSARCIYPSQHKATKQQTGASLTSRTPATRYKKNKNKK